MANIVNIQVNFYIIFFSTEKQDFQVISTIIRLSRKESLHLLLS